MTLAEQQTEWIISNNLVNKGWHIDGDSKLKNVYFQKPPYRDQQKKLKGKKPDYILYQTGTNIPIAIIEAKKSGINLEPALNQGTEYAKVLNVPLVFAMNGAYCETRFVPNNKELILNGEEVRELVREREALAFLNANSNETWTIPQEVKVSREELISQFRNLNDVLRSEGLRAGIERFSEFANILFLKLLSEDSQKSWWNSIKSQSNDDIVGYINGYVIEQIQNKYGGDVFTPISIKNPQTLRHIIDAIDPLILSTINTDIKGDAFEYFLEKTTSTENDLGEYFTPRNIVKTIINLVDPKFKETVYDPFCGTGGFLTEAFNYIKENNIIEGEEDLKRLRHNTLYGREITTTARIAKMNMVLHGDGHSGIQQINTLTNPDYLLPDGEIKKFDVIVTNMPFSQTITRKRTENDKTKEENNISPLYYNGIAKNSGDSACVLHCLRALKEGGRMALVVPEGFLFRKNLSAVRKFLLSKAKLQSVISLPQGVFLPYTGVKTDILYFTDAHKTNNQKEYWFFEAKNIGVTLNNHKKKIKGNNDLKTIESSDIKKIDKIPDLQNNMLETGFEIVNMEKVKSNDYNLVGSTYRELSKDFNYPSKKLDDISIEIKNGVNVNQDIEVKQYKVSRIESISEGYFNFKKVKYTNDKVKESDFLQKGDILFSHINSFSHIAKTAIFLEKSKDVIHGINLIKIRPNQDIVIPEYLLFTMKSESFIKNAKRFAKRAVNQASIRLSEIKEFEIPLPSLEEQQKIVNELDSYQKIVDGLKQAVNNWQPFFEIDKNWDIAKLGEICDVRDGTHDSPKYLNEGYSLVTSKHIINGKIDFKNTNLISKVDLDKINQRSLVNDGDIIMPMIGTIGHPIVVKKDREFAIKNVALIKLKNNSIVDRLYIKYLLDCKTTEFSAIAIGSTQKFISLGFIRSLMIPLPSLEEQQKIVEQLEQERKMIDSQKEIIELFETKIQNRLNSLWQSDT